MVEMLATLAIIGVLSIAALLGFRMAIDSHFANEILNNVRLAASTVFHHDQILVDDNGFINIDDFQKTISYDMNAIQLTASSTFVIEVRDVPKNICKATLNKVGDTYVVSVNNTRFDGKNTSPCAKEVNLMWFFFNPDQSCPVDCPTDRCCLEKCCATDEICVAGRCVKEILCDWSTENLCGEACCRKTKSCCSTTCCAGEMICCGKGCCPSGECAGNSEEGTCCGTDEEGNQTTASGSDCLCSDGVRILKDGTCQCPNATAPYFFDATQGGPLCCGAGQAPVDGVCHRIHCSGGPGANNYLCYINNLLCGYNCTSVGKNCSIGVCLADACRENETFSYIGQPYYYYGCKRVYDENTTCYNDGGTSAYRCYDNSDGLRCMVLSSSFSPLQGTCDESTCTDISATWFRYGNDANAYLGSCDFGNGLICTPFGSRWRCYKNGYTCGDNCSDPLNCGTCPTFECPDGMTYNAEKAYCETETYYCVIENGNLLGGCYMKVDDTRCGAIYNSLAFANGSCTDPGCPAGMKFASVDANNWGCIDETVGTAGMACSYSASYPTAICSYNRTTCGRYCNYDGTNCQHVYSTQCAIAGHCPQTGYDMSGGCICDGEESNGHCCPVGHTYINGACSIL